MSLQKGLVQLDKKFELIRTFLTWKKISSSQILVIQCRLLLISKQDIFVDLLNWSRYLGLTKRGGMFFLDF